MSRTVAFRAPRAAARMVAPLVLLAVVALAASAPRAEAARKLEGPNPTVAQKLALYDRTVRELRRPPDVLLLGSSKVLILDPAQIRRVTGLEVFNGGISNGATRDAEVMAMFADARWPRTMPHVVIGLDIESLDGRATPLRTYSWRRHLAALPTTHSCVSVVQCPHPAGALAGAVRLAAGAHRLQRGYPYLADITVRGNLRPGPYGARMAAGTTLAQRIDRKLALRVSQDIYRTGFTSLDPGARAALERTIRLANRHGVVPSVVLNPYHPRFLKVLGPRGWFDRRDDVREYLADLQSRGFRLRVHDHTWTGSFRGTGDEFYDEIHMRPLNGARLVHQLHRDGAWQRRPPD